ncbi:hypothetical protein GOBAR_DD28281 [Gossypium barbadense]|nr:hypothetical protein GOBAR_DD28281 [Gossypium barbadense]
MSVVRGDVRDMRGDMQELLRREFAAMPRVSAKFFGFGASKLGNLPAYVFNLMNLLILNVAHNYLSGKIAAIIQLFLWSIDLSSNDFSSEIQSNFSTDSQLQLINFLYNHFSSEVPTSIGYFQYLQYLWLDLNQLYENLPSTIANCSSLIHLSV